MTHGHPTGQLAAGALAVLIESVLDDATLAAADEVLNQRIWKKYPGF